MQKDEQLIGDWLAECRTEATRNSYAYAIHVFREWYGKPLTTFLALEPREMRHTGILFQNALMNGWLPRNSRTKGKLSANTVGSMLTALGSFCTYNDKTLRMKGKRVRKTIDLTSHSYSTRDLTKMLNVGNVEQKAILTTFCSLGWEVSAIKDLDRKFIENLIFKAQEERQQYIYFVSQRGKTGAIRLGVLNPLAIECLTEWLKISSGPRLFSYTTREGINHMIKHLARDAHVLATGRVHTHKIRAWVMSGLSRAGFNEFEVKYVVGKTIPMSDMTYLEGLRQAVEAKYPAAYEGYLDISGRTMLGIDQTDLEVLKQILPYLRQLTPEMLEEALEKQRDRKDMRT